MSWVCEFSFVSYVVVLGSGSCCGKLLLIHDITAAFRVLQAGHLLPLAPVPSRAMSIGDGYAAVVSLLLESWVLISFMV